MPLETPGFPMIRLEGLTKTFSGKCALHPLFLEIKAGEIFGFLGHNGAGKSTTFGLILGQLHPTAGEAFIRGVSVQRNRLQALQGIGAIFETPAFYDYLSGWSNLQIFTGYTARLTDAELRETVEFVGLTKRINDPVRVYSHGMRQRLALAQALLPRPDLVLLDEPAEGLDPEGIHEMRELILRLNRERGMTVVFSSHLLSEVEQMCQRVAILNQGRLIFNGPWTDLRGSDNHFELKLKDWLAATPVIARFGATIVNEGTIALSKDADIADLIAALVQAGARIQAVQPVRQSLEQMYLGTIKGAASLPHA